MKLRQYVKQLGYEQDVPKSILSAIGSILSDEHLKTLDERPIKTPEALPDSPTEQMTNEYPEWFVDAHFQTALDKIITQLQSKL